MTLDFYKFKRTVYAYMSKPVLRRMAFYDVLDDDDDLAFVGELETTEPQLFRFNPDFPCNTLMQ